MPMTPPGERRCASSNNASDFSRRSGGFVVPAGFSTLQSLPPEGFAVQEFACDDRAPCYDRRGMLRRADGTKGPLLGAVRSSLRLHLALLTLAPSSALAQASA